MEGKQALRFKSRWLSLSLLSLAILGVGCSKGWIRAYRLAPTTLTSEDAITVVGYETGSEGKQYSPEVEEDVIECIEEAFEDADSTFRIVPWGEFRRVAFPDVAPDERPPLVVSWVDMARDPVFQQRIAHLGVRYLIAVSVSDDSRGWKLNLGIYAIGASRETWATMRANIIDLVQARNAGSVTAESSGNSAAGLIVIFPFYVPSFPEWRACDELGDGLARFLAGETLPGIFPAVSDGGANPTRGLANPDCTRPSEMACW